MSTFLEPAGAVGSGHSRHFATLRRLYLYLVALICLIALQGYFRDLAGDLAVYWGVLDGQYQMPTFEPLNRRLLEKGSRLLAAALFLVIHYGLILGWVRRDPQELGSSLRKLFLFASTLVALGHCIPLMASLINPVMSQLMGLDQAFSGFYWAYYVALALPLSLSGTILIQGSSLLYAERNSGMASEGSQTLEAIFFALVNVVGLLVLASVVHMVLLRAWLSLALNVSTHFPVFSTMLVVPPALAAALTLLLALHQVAGWRFRLGQGRHHLSGDVLHTLVLYGGLLTGLVISLYGLLLALQALLALLDESRAEVFDLWPQLVNALGALLPLGVVYWTWFRRSLSRAPETARLGRWRTVPRQLYLYSGISVTLFWVTVGSHKLILDGPEPVALTQLLIGGPALFLLWRQIRRLGPEPVALAFRALHLLPRRLYLYGVTIVSTLTLLFFSGQVLQELLGRLLGWHALAILPTGDFTHAAVMMAVMAIMLALHVRLLRQPWGPPLAVASQEETAMVSLQQELAAAYEQRRQTTDRIHALEQRLAELSPAASTENQEP